MVCQHCSGPNFWFIGNIDTKEQSEQCQNKITHPECETFYKTASPACQGEKKKTNVVWEEKTGLNEVTEKHFEDNWGS